MIIDREYKGRRYRVMERMDDQGRMEYFISVPRKTWFGFGKEVWEPLASYEYRGKLSPYSGGSLVCDTQREVLLCWTTSSANTEKEFKAMVDAEENRKRIKKIKEDIGERPVEVE